MNHITLNPNFPSGNESDHRKLYINKFSIWPSSVYSKDYFNIDSDHMTLARNEIYLKYLDVIIKSETSFNLQGLNYIFTDHQSSFHIDETPSHYYAHKNQEDEDMFNGICEIIKKHSTQESKKYIHLVHSGPSGFYTNKHVIKRANSLNIEDNYNDKVVEGHYKLTKHFNDPKAKGGIILLHGEPGTGKTSYIRYLLESTKKKIILINRSVAANIDGPDFTKFLLDYCNDSIFLIEDAEQLLVSRKNQSNSAVSTLLNLSDGLLGDCINLNIICTFNENKSTIDPALLRKGRLIEMIDFTPLTVEKANVLAKKLNSGQVYDKPVKLTDVYNHAGDNVEFNKVAPVGFQFSEKPKNVAEKVKDYEKKFKDMSQEELEEVFKNSDTIDVAKSLATGEVYRVVQSKPNPNFKK